MTRLTSVSREAAAQSSGVITESTVRALVILSVATTTLMMRSINGNIDLTSQRTQVVSRLHVRVVVIVSLNLQLRLQSRVCRIGETNRTIKFSGTTTSVCRGYIGDDEIRQLLKGSLDCGARLSRGGNRSGLYSRVENKCLQYINALCI